MPRSSKSRLSEYRAKRNFSKTPEPTGNSTPRIKAPKRRKAPMFCVQKHLASSLHYDFRLEHDGVLLSWAVPKGPSLNPSDKRLAMQTEDHPLDYGNFEGVIPEGYGAGIVMLWDTGTWEPQVDDVDAAIAKGELKFKLNGVKLKGSWVLVRTRGFSTTGPSRSWLLIKHRDEWAGNIDITKAAPDSVENFGDFADILASEKPEVWGSHKPAEGRAGASGKMMLQIIEEAAKRRLKRETKSSRKKTPSKARPSTRKSVKRIKQAK